MARMEELERRRAAAEAAARVKRMVDGEKAS